MTALALHVPERLGIGRWAFAAIAIVIAHATAIGALAYWYTRTPPEEKLIPAIVVSLAPEAPTTPMESDQPVAAQDSTKVDPSPAPQVEIKAEPPPEEIKPPPLPRPSEIVLPKPEPKPVEKKLVEKKPVEKKPVEKRPVEKRPGENRPAQDDSVRASAPEASRQSSVAGSNNYNSLVYGHLQRFRSYPTSANGAKGHVVVHFVLGRSGAVLSAGIAQSSGNAALDAEALGSVRRASPFPPFPMEKAAAQDSFTAPINFN
jgi:protein TonB